VLNFVAFALAMDILWRYEIYFGVFDLLAENAERRSKTPEKAGTESSRYEVGWFLGTSLESRKSEVEPV
jgi:hypothetical protein